jgi:hypothetical protein
VLSDLHLQKMDKKGEEWEEVMEGKRVLPKYSAVEQAHYDLKK